MQEKKPEGNALAQRHCTPVRLSETAVRSNSAARPRRSRRTWCKPHGLLWPAIGLDDRAVIAVEPLRAVDQQVPDPMRADMAQGDGRPLVALRSSSRRVDVGGRAHASLGSLALDGRRPDAAA